MSLKADNKPLALAPMDSNSNVELNIRNLHAILEDNHELLKRVVELVNALADIHGID